MPILLTHICCCCSVMSNSLLPHGLQHARLPCPLPSPGACSNSCPLNRFCNLTISSSVILFSSCLLSFPASGSFPMSQHFSSGGQSTGASASASVLPMTIQSWYLRIDWYDLAVQGTLKSLLQHHRSKASILLHSAFFIVQLSHQYMTTGETIASTRWTFVGKVMSLLFDMLPRFVIAFLPRSKHLLISWLQSPSTEILEPKKINSVTVSTVSPFICHRVKGLDGMIFVFWRLNFRPAFHSPLSPSSRGCIVNLNKGIPFYLTELLLALREDNKCRDNHIVCVQSLKATFIITIFNLNCLSLILSTKIQTQDVSLGFSGYVHSARLYPFM